ncbi:hypothetical protein HP398_08835 [Brevibacillus sp. HB1.4B]|uniref:hypothetical protein n=1 Tax=Brevibacillus TaxID=55080 RepID=UPI00035C2CA4|nr:MULTISPECIES: hypothetical protein [unclassified Brevibacillus]ATF12292.1 hypothetical protein A616_09870 [Brevibacillus brevis X23]NRS16537.1 hypothetical protein [Brevibacillus sp. HB1.4B]NTU34253.1 hypothetical protein [Brevibacillus sp. HB1.1]
MKRLASVALSIFSLFAIVSSASAASPHPVQSNVTAPVTVTKLVIEEDIPRYFYPGDYAPIWVTAFFSDGTSKVVSNEVNILEEAACEYIKQPRTVYAMVKATHSTGSDVGWFTVEYGGVEKTIYFSVR